MQEENGCEFFFLCRRCSDSVDKGDIPKYSIENGVDFGNYKRLGLIEPNVQEKAIISKFRKYIAVVKIRRNSSRKTDYTMNRINAHFVLIADDSTGVVIQCWSL